MLQFIVRISRAFCAARTAQRTAELEHEVRGLRQELLEARSTMDVLVLERDRLLAVCERDRQRVEAETKIHIACGVKATGESERQP